MHPLVGASDLVKEMIFTRDEVSNVNELNVEFKVSGDDSVSVKKVSLVFRDIEFEITKSVPPEVMKIFLNSGAEEFSRLGGASLVEKQRRELMEDLSYRAWREEV